MARDRYVFPRPLLSPQEGHRNPRARLGTSRSRMRRSTLQLVIASFALVLPPGAASLSARPPITLIGGFLGAGKTAAVTSLLSSRAGLKIAVVCQRGIEPRTSGALRRYLPLPRLSLALDTQLVNDLASVNVDAGTVRRASAQEDGVETIELQNGCVCCGAGASAELAPILRRLGGQGFDHLVVELSGVADPVSIKPNHILPAPSKIFGKMSPRRP